MLNSNEIRKLLSEINFTDAFIQKVNEHSYHSFTFSLFSKTEKAFQVYFEIGTVNQHFCKTEVMRKKSGKSQRFTQFLRANIVGSRILSVHQIEGERVFTLTLSHGGEIRKLVFRYFSGPLANVFVTDEDDRILEVLMRRPQRGEEAGKIYTNPPAKGWDEEKFPIRPFEGESFNAFIDHCYRDEERAKRQNIALESLTQKTEKEIGALIAQIRDVEERVRHSQNYETLKETADILSANSWQLERGKSSANLFDFEGRPISIRLDPSLSPSENINAFYQKYKREERIYNNALEELKSLKTRLEERKAFLKTLTEGSEDEVARLTRGEAGKTETKTSKKPLEAGLRFSSHGFDILVGRNARENDIILRKYAASNDTWLHTRDWAGSYVIIKGKKDKSIPLDVLLDAANLAIHYSKAKDAAKADLYYTKVKYLRRAKDGKKGLVIPTNEKNLFVALDEERVRTLLLSKEEAHGK